MTKEFKPPSDTFCVLPWVHLSTRTDGQMRVCCTANASSVGATNVSNGGAIGALKDKQGRPNNLNVSDFVSSWNSTYMQNVRTQMLNGEQPASCTKCYKEEAAGHRSKRQWETNYWAERLDVQDLIDRTDEEGNAPEQLAYIDLRFGTKCQLACVMCSPHDSSGWVKDWKKVFPTIENKNIRDVWQWDNKGSVNGSSYNWHKQNPVFWKQFYTQVPHMRQLYFAGGEALIIDEHYEILEECIRQGYAKNMELRYNSNAVEWRDDLFELWKEFKLVRFHYSVDSIFEMNEYIRYPSKWERTEEVFHILDNETSDNVEITIACAVNALNLYYMPDFIKWKMEKKFRKVNMWPFGAGTVNSHFVYWPPFLNVKSLPNWFKDKCEEKYNAFYPWMEENWELCIPLWHRDKVTYDEWRDAAYGIKRLQGLISFAKSEDWSVRLPEMQEYLEKLDAQRDHDFYTAFPEMSDIFDKKEDPNVILRG